MSPRSPKPAKSISLKQLAALVGEPESTIDYWTKMGLLTSTRQGNARYYDPDLNADRCRHIRQRKNDGFNLAAIKREIDRQG